ncbi:MAG: EamA family transporter [Homoserinimonas sp.]
MLTVALGITSALVAGAADFFGGIASKRLSPLRVTALAALSGLLLMLVASPFVAGVWSVEAMMWGALSGAAAAIAIALLYACLAIGPMSILSPLTAVISAAVPVTLGLLTGALLHPIAYPALGLALVAVVLVGIVPNDTAPGQVTARPTARGLVMAVASGTMIGVFLILLDLTPEESGLIPLIFNRAGNGIVMCTLIAVAIVVARGKRTPKPAPVKTIGWRHKALTVALAAGLIDGVANIALLAGMRVGDLTVISVLSALYPAGTIILAGIFLRERITRMQLLGLILALVAAGLLALV